MNIQPVVPFDLSDDWLMITRAIVPVVSQPSFKRVRPEQRKPQLWKDVIYIEAAPPGKVTVLTLFVTVDEPALRHESEPSFCLGSLRIGNGRFAQLVAHSDPEGNLMDLIEQNVAVARTQAESAGVEIPKEAYAYFFGRQNDGCRLVVGARLNRPNSAGQQVSATP